MSNSSSTIDGGGWEVVVRLDMLLDILRQESSDGVNAISRVAALCKAKVESNVCEIDVPRLVKKASQVREPIGQLIAEIEMLWPGFAL